MSDEKVFIEDDIIFLTIGKYELFMSYGKVGMDACSLYLHYMFTCRRQETNSIWATDTYVRQGLSWTRERLQKAKTLLSDLDLISFKRIRNDDGTLGKSYVIVKTRTAMLEINHVSEIHQMDTPTDGKLTTNALTNKEMLKQERKIYSTSEKFEKPTISEVQEYLDSKNITSFDAETFWNFYESKGWMIGKNKMHSWKACVGTWVKNSRTKKEVANDPSFIEAPAGMDMIEAMRAATAAVRKK